MVAAEIADTASLIMALFLPWPPGWPLNGGRFTGQNCWRTGNWQAGAALEAHRAAGVSMDCDVLEAKYVREWPNGADMAPEFLHDCVRVMV